MATVAFDKVKKEAKRSTGGDTTVVATLRGSAALDENDLIGPIPVPEGATFTDYAVHVVGVDTNATATATISLGDATTDNLLIADFALANSGAYTRCLPNTLDTSTVDGSVTAGVGYTVPFDADSTTDSVDFFVKVDAAVATGGTTPEVVAVLSYTVDAF